MYPRSIRKNSSYQRGSILLFCRKMSLVLALLLAIVTSTRGQAGGTGDREQVSSHGRDSQRETTAAALVSMFNPQLALENKRMGLVQRNFLDLVEGARPNLQIALVIDGTDSMAETLHGIRDTIGRMIDDLSLYKGANVSFQLVVFRDAGAENGDVIFPLKSAGKKFTANRQALQQALTDLAPATGAPYFHELIDAGIEQAIRQLEWDDDNETTRWLLVFGDAPPFDAGFEEPDSHARRRVATDHLISLATNRGIHINCVLCPTRPQDQAVYEQVLDKTRNFMSRISSDTGGLMLDLSYPDIRQAIQQASQRPRTEYTRIGSITEADIEAMRRQTAREGFALAEDQKLRVVVLPHLPLDQLSFNTRLTEVRIATDLRQRLRQLPGVEVVSSGLVRRQLSAMQRRNVEQTAMLPTLAAVLRADYILWGQLHDQGKTVRVESAIYDGVAGRSLAKNTVQSSGQPGGEATSDLVQGLIRQASNQTVDRKLQVTMATLQRSPNQVRPAITRVSNTASVEALILEAYELLEQATAYNANDPESLSLLTQAERKLAEAVGPDGDSRNPYAHYLLATSYFNQAQHYTQTGQQESASERMRLFRAAMNQAFRSRGRAARDVIKLEIDADFALLVKQDTQAAIEAYETMAGMGQPSASDNDVPLPVSHTTLRAHWMLAGIYSGDWGVEKKWVEPEKARFHLLQILAHWPDSREAEFIRKSLRWDEQEDATSFDHFPTRNNSLLEDV